MINLDLNSALHPRVGELLSPFVPGLFAEICVLLTSSQAREHMVSIAGANHYYTTVAIALFVAFVVGNAFLLWVRFIQMRLDDLIQSVPKVREWQLQRLRAKYSRQVQESLRNQAPGTVQTPPPVPKTLQKLEQAAARDSDIEEAQSARLAWILAASAVLEHYGVDTSDQYWTYHTHAWSGAIGKFHPEEYRGNLLVMTLHAAGWSGLSAWFYAPFLGRAHYFYLAFCGFLIVLGLLHDWELAKSQNDPVQDWLRALRRTVTELKEIATSQALLRKTRK
jgi:hypothetical protein